MEAKNIYAFARDGKLRRLKVSLEKSTREEVQKVIAQKYNGATPLVIASKNGHLDIVEYLVTKCNADIEQVGNVQFDGETIEGAPPLWCAAAAGHFAIVKMLVTNMAQVNSTTKTKSTPLRAACYDGHLDIVQFLINAGADIEIANRHGHTCLMIACYKGHFKIARFLIEYGADVNRKSVKGNTALHDCAESGSLEIMELLLSNEARMEVDSYGVTPLIAAALTGHSPIVELIIVLTACDRQERIDALELLGSTYVDKKRDMMGALEYWRRAINERLQSPPMFKTPPPVPVPSYDNAVEVTTVPQLEELFSDPDLMRMQALLVRERILGVSHPDTSYYIRYRGAVYADTGNFDRCIKLWMYALDMQQKILDPLNPMIQSSLLSFAELFSFMMSKSVSTTKFCDLFAVFQRALCELQSSVLSCRADCAEQDSQNFHRTLVIVLHFIGLLCRLQPHLNEDEELELKKAVYRLVRLNPRGRSGWSPLHLACFRDSSTQSVRFPLCDFPMAEMLKLLLEVGASPHDVDVELNTPLHIAAAIRPPMPEVFTTLLNHGGHIDAKNARGETPLQLLDRNAPAEPPSTTIYPLRYVSLQCLCAQAIVQQNISYEGQLPEKLEEFVKVH